MRHDVDIELYETNSLRGGFPFQPSTVDISGFLKLLDGADVTVTSNTPSGTIPRGGTPAWGGGSMGGNVIHSYRIDAPTFDAIVSYTESTPVETLDSLTITSKVDKTLSTRFGSGQIKVEQFNVLLGKCETILAKQRASVRRQQQERFDKLIDSITPKG